MKLEAYSHALILKSIIWKLSETFLSKGISILTTIILARLLLPKDYGIIALTTIFLQLSDILIQAGFSTALIRKKQIYEEDYSTVLGISLIVAVCLYVLIFIFAPYISNFYGIPQLTNVLRWLSIILFCQAFSSVCNARVAREMKFKFLFICSAIANILSGVVGIICAFYGAGVWALVAQQLIQQLFLTLSLLFFTQTKIKIKIYKDNAKELFSFGINVLIASILSFLGDSIYNLSIGKSYNMTDLGYYEKGSFLPRNIALYTFGSLFNVFLPVMASLQDDTIQLNTLFQRILDLTLYIICPVMTILYVLAPELVSLLLTDKWLPMVGVMRCFCIYYAVLPILLAHMQLHLAIGRSDVRLKIEIERNVIMIGCLLPLLRFQAPIETIAFIVSIIQIIITISISIESHKLIDFDMKYMLKNVIQVFGCLLIMVVALIILNTLSIFNSILSLFFKSIVSIFTYVIVSMILRCRAYLEIKRLIMMRKQQERNVNSWLR